MDRRSFLKTVGALAVFPALPVLAKKGFTVADCIKIKETLEAAELRDGIVPAKYRGFEIRFSSYRGDAKHICADDGKYWTGALYPKEKPDYEIWKSYKPYLDKAIDRHRRKINDGRKHLNKRVVLGVGQ